MLHRHELDAHDAHSELKVNVHLAGCQFSVCSLCLNERECLCRGQYVSQSVFYLGRNGAGTFKYLPEILFYVGSFIGSLIFGQLT